MSWSNLVGLAYKQSKIVHKKVQKIKKGARDMLLTYPTSLPPLGIGRTHFEFLRDRVDTLITLSATGTMCDTPNFFGLPANSAFHRGMAVNGLVPHLD